MSALIGERSVDYTCSTFYTGMCSMCFESPLNKLWDAVSLESTTTDIFSEKIQQQFKKKVTAQGHITAEVFTTMAR